MGGESEGDGAGIGAKGTYGSSPAPADSAQWFLEDDSRVAITGRGDAPKLIEVGRVAEEIVGQSLVPQGCPANDDLGIEKYLGSGMIRSIGPIYAKKLARAFGKAVFDVIQQEPIACAK